MDEINEFQEFIKSKLSPALLSEDYIEKIRKNLSETFETNFELINFQI